jgi:hypothetical protein
MLLQCYCHVIAMLLPCYCLAEAELLRCFSSAIAVLLHAIAFACHSIAIALLLPSQCNAIAMLLPCYLLISSCPCDDAGQVRARLGLKRKSWMSRRHPLRHLRRRIVSGMGTFVLVAPRALPPARRLDLGLYLDSRVLTCGSPARGWVRSTLRKQSRPSKVQPATLTRRFLAHETKVFFSLVSEILLFLFTTFCNFHH